MTSEPNFVLEVAGGVAKLRLRRLPVNAFSLAYYGEIEGVLNSLIDQDQTRCLMIGSALARVFSGGADVNDFKAAAANPDSGELREQAVEHFWHAIREFPYPTIAVVDGAAVGTGCVLAALCDIRVASNAAWFSIPEVNVARVGGPHPLRRVLPEGVMRHIYFTAGRLDAERAYQLGFVQVLSSQDAVWEVAHEMASGIAAKSPVGLRLGKRAINDAEFASFWDGYTLEQQYSYRLSRLDANRLIEPRTED